MLTHFLLNAVKTVAKNPKENVVFFLKAGGSKRAQNGNHL